MTAPVRLEAACHLAKERKCFSLAHSENLLLDNSGIHMGCTHALDAKPKQADEKKGYQIFRILNPYLLLSKHGLFLVRLLVLVRNGHRRCRSHGHSPSDAHLMSCTGFGVDLFKTVFCTLWLLWLQYARGNPDLMLAEQGKQIQIVWKRITAPILSVHFSPRAFSKRGLGIRELLNIVLYINLKPSGRPSFIYLGRRTKSMALSAF